MGCFLDCLFSLKIRHLTISLALLLIPSSTQYAFMAEGRAISSSVGEENTRESAVIGSRPPRCERRCSSCGHCEPVQVPITPQRVKDRFRVKPTAVQSQTGAIKQNSRGDGLSNYKPMSWKCKCGSFIYDP